MSSMDNETIGALRMSESSSGSLLLRLHRGIRSLTLGKRRCIKGGTAPA